MVCQSGSLKANKNSAAAKNSRTNGSVLDSAKRRREKSSASGQRHRDSCRSQSTPKHRWIPPSALRRDALSPQDHNDIIFRKVRGILNKLTPEKFGKLSNDILEVGLDSTLVLKGVILLIFEKALDEPKYSSLYAQLCKRLSEKAPNFDPPDSPCTFNRLLLNKCRDEFENRSKATEVYENHDGPLSKEDEEQSQLAKRKMLGNIKFIGELGKLQMLHISILHECCQQLLRKKKRGNIREMAEDLECLCQIMKTCGRSLDKEKAKGLMDQYFARMCVLAANPELPPRIRFMLQDVIELRSNRWVPRRVACAEGPRPVTQMREEAAREGIYLSTPGMPGHRDIGPMSAGMGLLQRGNKSRTGMDDVFGPLPIGATSLGTGPGVITNQEKFGFTANGYSGFRPRQQFMPNQHQNFQNRQNFGQQSFNNKQQNSHIQQQQQLQLQQNYGNAASSKDLPPRFKKMMLAQQGVSSGSEDVSLRPSANSMILKPSTPGALPKSAQGSVSPLHQTLGPMDAPTVPQQILSNQKPSPPIMHKEIPIVIKQGQSDKPKGGKRDKGPSKSETLKKVEDIFDDLSVNQSVKEAVTIYKDAKLPDKFIQDITTHFIKMSLKKSETERELVSHLLLEMKNESLMTPNQFLESFSGLLGQMVDLEAHIPRVKSYLAGFAAQAVADKFVPLSDVTDLMENGKHYPMVLLILQQLHKKQGRSDLSRIFKDSKVNLMSMLPEVDRTKDRLAEVLEDRELSFLLPLLRIQSDLWKQIQVDATPTQFYRWIKDNLEPSNYIAPGFISALVTVILKYITMESTLGKCVDPTTQPDQNLTDKEKDLLEKFKPVLQHFLHDHVNLQVIAVYALQVFTYTEQFPKGMLLRWFMYLYDMEIVEEEAFLNWKEDVNDEYPGKGKALFQVNQWLTWLEQAETEEEDDDDDDDIDL